MQAGGGYRTLAAIDGALAAGAARVMVGTAALSPAFVREAVERFGDRLVIAVDARDGHVLAEGWTKTSSLAARPRAGVRRRRSQTPPRHEHGPRRLAGRPRSRAPGRRDRGIRPSRVGRRRIASLDDLDRLRELGCEGAILGSALWSGRIRLGDALQRAKSEPPKVKY